LVVLTLTACGADYKSVGSTQAPASDAFAGSPPSDDARCAYIDERGGYGGDWYSADYLLCAEPGSQARYCYAHTSLLFGDRWGLQGFDEKCRAAERAAVDAGDLPPRA
jgi:hypothetical protein